MEVDPHGFLLALRPAEGASALQAFGYLDPAVVVPEDRHYLPSVLAAEQEDGLRKRHHFHLILNYPGQCSGTLAHVR